MRMTRGISAPWWYTAYGVFFFELMLVLLWAAGLFGVMSVLVVINEATG